MTRDHFETETGQPQSYSSNNINTIASPRLLSKLDFMIMKPRNRYKDHQNVSSSEQDPVWSRPWVMLLVKSVDDLSYQGCCPMMKLTLYRHNTVHRQYPHSWQGCVQCCTVLHCTPVQGSVTLASSLATLYKYLHSRWSHHILVTSESWKYDNVTDNISNIRHLYGNNKNFLKHESLLTLDFEIKT